MKIFLDLMWFFKKEKKAYLTGIFLLLVVAVLELIPPKIIGIVVDRIAQKTLTFSSLLRFLSILLLVAIIVYIVRFFWRVMIFGASIRLSRLLRNQLYEHFTKMSQAFYQRKRIGDLMAHSTNDLQAIQQTAGAGVLTLVDSLATGGFVLITMASTISWKLTLIALIPMPFMALSTNYYGKLLHRRFHKAQEAFSSLNDKVQESISGIRVIKAFGQEREDIHSFREQLKDVYVKNLAVAKVDSLFDPTISLIVGLSFFLSISFGAKFVISGELSIGELVTFTTYLGLLSWPMLAFGWLFNIVERGRASYDRVNNLLSEKVDIEDHPHTIKEIPSGNIDFHIRSFSYPNQSQPAIQNVHFSLNQGETLGIVGKTGAGKTTLLKLLIREFEGYDGLIKIGGRDIRDYHLESLRKAIGYVPQDHFLFSATIRENIAFAKPDATDREIEQAAILACIHEDITQFIDGYDTVVGERGVSLSGGQKQRVSIARALLLDPEILILDDSLSAVDAKTEENILAALIHNRKGKTTIITSHRLSAVKHAELIIVLDEGMVIQMGNHEQLVNQDGWYREMYVRQQLESMVEHGG
jgi:ATP-binding cassette, subfamily B, multidrug efflux pump